jgi:hypothetical protein
VNVTGEPVSPEAVAVIVFAPAVVPSVHDPTVAMPEEFEVVVNDVPDPPPVATAKVTDRLATGLPAASVTRTDGAVATAEPAVAVWLLPAFTAMVAAAPAPVGVMDDDVTDVRPVEAKVRVYEEVMSPAKVRFVNVATPLTAALPDVACVPPSVPPDAVTVTVAVAVVRLPYASTTRTTGWVPRAAPDAPAAGCVPTASFDAVPTETVTDRVSEPVEEIVPSVTEIVAVSIL